LWPILYIIKNKTYIIIIIIMWTVEKSKRSNALTFFLRKIIQIILNKEL
jgi:hypothetical protein